MSVKIPEIKKTPVTLNSLDYQVLAEHIVEIESQIQTFEVPEKTVRQSTNSGVIVTDVDIDIPTLESMVIDTYNALGYDYVTKRLRVLAFGNTGLIRIVCSNAEQVEREPDKYISDYRSFVVATTFNQATVTRGYYPFTWVIVTGNALYAALLNQRGVLNPDIFVNTGSFVDNTLSITAVRAYGDIIMPNRAFIYDPVIGFEREVYNVRTLNARLMITLNWIPNVYINPQDYIDTQIHQCDTCKTDLYDKYYFNLGMRHCKFCAHRAGLTTSERNPALVRKAALTYREIINRSGFEHDLAEIFKRNDYAYMDKRHYANDSTILFTGTVSAYIMCADTINPPISQAGIRKKVILINVAETQTANRYD